MEFLWEMDDAKLHVTATSGDTRLVFTLADLEDLIEGLGRARKAMQPPVSPAHWPPGQKVPVELNPAWTAERAGFVGGALIHFRDPRFGWIHYVMPPLEAKSLGEVLVAIGSTPTEHPPKSRQN